MRSISNIASKLYYYSPVRSKSSLFLAFVFFYFVFHLITGERGLLAYARLQSEISTKSEQYEQLHEQKVDLSTRVSGMRDDSLDLDLLEEIARKDLGYSKKDEVVLFDE